MIKLRKETIYQNNYKSKVLVIHSILLRAKEVDQQLIILNLWDNKYTRYVSFKETSTKTRLGALYTYNMINIKLKFEILEDISVNQLVIVKGEMYWLKDYLLSLKNSPNHLFLGTKQNIDKYSKDIFIIIAPNKK